MSLDYRSKIRIYKTRTNLITTHTIETGAETIIAKNRNDLNVCITGNTLRNKIRNEDFATSARSKIQNGPELGNEHGDIA